MSRPKAQLRLGAFFNPTGHHVASWRHPQSQADAGINFKHYVEIAQTAERGKFDMIFLADNIGVREAHIEALSRSAQYIANFEPRIHARDRGQHRRALWRRRLCVSGACRTARIRRLLSRYRRLGRRR